MSKKVLIIGSQGYLGSRLTDYLQEYGYCCTGIDTGFFKYGQLYEPKPVSTIKTDARLINELDLVGYDVVLLLAGISNDPFGDLNPDKIYNPTREYTLRIAKICKKLGLRFIFPSSCSVYGIGAGLSHEDSPTYPQTPYSLNKLQIEQDLAMLSDDSFSPIALRLATVFGASPRIRFDVVINMLCGMALTRGKIILNSNGQAWRPHVYIDDVCRAFALCIDWNYQDGKLMVLNVGSNENNMQVLEVAKLIKSKFKDCKLVFLEKVSQSETTLHSLINDKKINDGIDKRTYKVLFDKIGKEIPNFNATWNLDKGITQLISDLRNNNLDNFLFSKRDFYRLQQLDYLYKNGHIDDNLYFTMKS